MFALRGIAVSLTFFVLLYCLLSALVAMGWRSLRWVRTSEGRLVAWLFGLRVLPLTVALIVTFGFVVPSFQLLEPRSIDEGTGAAPLALGICALLLLFFGCWRVIAALMATSRVVARWSQGARVLADAQTVTVLSTRDAPPLTLVGVRKPKVLVSESTLALLSQDELRIALEHERSHVRSRDNLKKLVFRFCPFLGMQKLERAWSESAELAADDAAVSNLDDAVALASALVKLSRLVPVDTSVVCTVGFVSGSIRVRVSRLLAWEDVCMSRRPRTQSWYLLAPAVVALLFIFATYGPALALAHEATEWLVR
jgi:Zn-dependent protease with chaperone function